MVAGCGKSATFSGIVIPGERHSQGDAGTLDVKTAGVEKSSALKAREARHRSLDRRDFDVLPTSVVVGDVDAPPLVADFLVMDLGIVHGR